MTTSTPTRRGGTLSGCTLLLSFRLQHSQPVISPHPLRTISERLHPGPRDSRFRRRSCQSRSLGVVGPGYRNSSVALAGGAGVDALAYRRERQRARPRRLRRSSAAVRLRLARCLRVRNLVRRTLRFGPYSGPRARGPSTSMRRSRSVVAHIGCAGFFGARCAGRAVAIVVLSLGIERWQ